MKVAIYDFDGTIYKKETFPLLMDHLKHHPTLKVYSKFYRSVLPIYLAYNLKLYPEAKMKSEMMKRYLRALRQLDLAGIDKYFTDIADKMLDDYHQTIIESIYEHKKADFYLMVVSGAYTPLLNAALRGLPIDEIIGTEVPFLDDKMDLSGDIVHVQAERKKLFVRESLKDAKVDWGNSYAYGDSYSDLSILELVGHPIAVSPDEKLEQVANNRKWQIIR